MNQIILQILLNYTRKIGEILSEESFNINTSCPRVESVCIDAAREICEEHIEELNRAFREDKKFRREHGLVLKEKSRKRQILTALGWMNVSRDCYRDKESGSYVTPLDQILGIDKYQRISGAVGAELVTEATEHSYAESARIVTDGAVSRQSVRNMILKIRVPEKEPAERGKKVSELHVFADEDHVHMQRPNKEKGKKNQIVPEVTVTEGIENVGEGRNRTVNPMHFVDEGFDSKRLWKSVSGYILQAYDLDEIQKIWVHADGGNWIRNGLCEFEQTEHVIDRFHFEREMRSINRRFPGKNTSQSIRAAIENDDRKRADRILQKRMNESESKQDLEATRQFGTYLTGHWEEIRNCIVEQPGGSCTEAIISHMLSERFSRNPMGWSKAGLGRLSAARIYIKNGGKLTYENFGESESKERYGDHLEHLLDADGISASDWSLFEGSPVMIPDQNSGTQQILRKMGQPTNILS